MQPGSRRGRGHGDNLALISLEERITLSGKQSVARCGDLSVQNSRNGPSWPDPASSGIETYPERPVTR